MVGGIFLALRPEHAQEIRFIGAIVVTLVIVRIVFILLRILANHA